jgi:S1-C subfamily serine protease
MTRRERYVVIFLALFTVFSTVIPLSCDDYVPNGEETITSTTTTTTTTTTTQPSPSKTTAPTPSTSVTSGPDVTTEPSSTYVTPVFPVGEIYNDISPAVVSVRVSIPATSLYNKRDEIFSGLLIDESGLIITTYSLMERAIDYRGNLLRNASISIFVNGMPKAFPATLVGYHSSTDLALLKIVNPDKLVFRAAPLAKDPAFYVGMQVASIGYPPMTVSTGGLTMGYVTSIYRKTFEEDGAPLGLIEKRGTRSLPHFTGRGETTRPPQIGTGT